MTRKETLESVRIRLADCAADMLRIQSPTGPNALDLSIARDIVTVIGVLGPEESAAHQLQVADDALGWSGSGEGRIERIARLLNQK